MPTQAQRGGRGTASKLLTTSTMEEQIPTAKEDGWDSVQFWTGTENLTHHWDSITRPSSTYKVTIPSTSSWNTGRFIIHLYLYQLKITHVRKHAHMHMRARAHTHTRAQEIFKVLRTVLTNIHIWDMIQCRKQLLICTRNGKQFPTYMTLHSK
jgi:hypothetical protein